MKITEKSKSDISALQKYETPVIELVEVMPEQGFALSSSSPSGINPDPNGDEFG